MKKIKVLELFAGVGGFRIALEGFEGKSASSNYTKNKKTGFKVIWSNQYEPSLKKIQHANSIYKKRWPNSNHSEIDIEKVIKNQFDEIPNHDLLVAGFPCQDYSVAGLLQKSKGLYGKKGVLWWSIYTILKRKKIPPKYLILENVPRIINTPRDKKGKDFYTILACLNELGYAAEWRIINAADYGFPQKRKRIYIIGIHKTSSLFDEYLNNKPSNIVFDKGILANAFPHKEAKNKISNLFEIPKIKGIGLSFKQQNIKIKSCGIMINNIANNFSSSAEYSGDRKKLKDVLQPINKVGKDTYIDFKKKLPNPINKNIRTGNTLTLHTYGDKWRYVKGKKNEWKINKSSGYRYPYDEGKMNLFEDFNSPSRTLITREITKTPNRLTHLIKQGKIIRNLTPIEMERLNMFPDNHTQDELITKGRRSFLMGNALVIGVIEKIGDELENKINIFKR